MQAAPPSPSLRPAVILVRPQEQGNVGAVARAMANMGLSELILVEPAVELGLVARQFSMHAWSLVEGAQHTSSLAEAIRPFAWVVGTTATRGRSVPGPLVDAREAARNLAATPSRAAALVFGPERGGLTTEELALCSQVVKVPTATAHPTLNLSQAVLILCYETFLARESATAEVAAGQWGGEVVVEAPAASEQIEGLFGQLTAWLRQIGFARDSTFEQVLRDLRRLAARSGASEREISLLRGILRRAGHHAGRVGPPRED